MGSNKNWTDKEKQYLEDNWGSVSIGTIVKHLGRSNNAILIMKQRLSLGQFLQGGDYVTWNQLIKTLGYKGGGYMIKTWITDRGFPIHTKRVNNNSFKVIYIDEFWMWAETHKAFVDFSKLEENALGKEPEWVKSKRKLDYEQKRRIKTTPWTPLEDAKLSMLISKQKYSFSDISKELQRTCGAIQRRCRDLNLKDRPVKADNHTPWNQDEISRLDCLIKEGYKYEAIAENIGKSAKAIRGFVYRFYLTENLDRVRGYIKNNRFGENVPTRSQIKQTEEREVSWA